MCPTSSPQGRYRGLFRKGAKREKRREWGETQISDNSFAR